MDSRFRLTNPHLNRDDHLYHLGIHAKDDLESRFSDVRFVCLGGKPSRMKEFAAFMYKKLGQPQNSVLDENKELHDLSHSAGRYSMYKVGPILSASHGIGMSSLTVVLHEILKLLHYSNCHEDVKIIRIGTSGGLGVEPGTLIITDQPHNSLLQPKFVYDSAGKQISTNCVTDPTMRHGILECSESEGVPAVIGNTMSTDDFFEGQGRLDGAFCDYKEDDKMKFLRKAHGEFGIKNIEMETACLAAMCNRAGLPCAAVCVTFLDRLKIDVVKTSVDILNQWQRQLYLVVGAYIQKSIASSVESSLVNGSTY